MWHHQYDNDNNDRQHVNYTTVSRNIVSSHSSACSNDMSLSPLARSQRDCLNHPVRRRSTHTHCRRRDGCRHVAPETSGGDGGGDEDVQQPRHVDEEDERH